MTMNTPC